MRYKVSEDDLKSKTHAFTTDEMRRLGMEEDEEDDEEDDDADEFPYEVILDEMDEVDTTDSDPNCLPQHMSDFSFVQIRNEGTKGCGYNDDLPVPPIADNLESWIENGLNLNNSQQNRSTATPKDAPPSIRKIVELLLSKKEARTRANVFERNPDVKVNNADGSISSIKDWARAAGLDEIQTRAFECIIASFLLTFYDDAGDGDDGNDDHTSHSMRSKFRRQEQHLHKLKGDKEKQLICLLHGPGGSGKSTVINLVTSYAKEFCENLGYPFTSRTIVVTAMSGVAATLLHGETTHKALGLNSKLETIKGDDDMLKAWAHTRLVIIDEVSFAGEQEFEKIYHHLGALMQRPFKPFGNLSIVFAGDYSQLEPPGEGRLPIYHHSSEGCELFNNKLTTYIELDGKHRFKDDPEWGERMLRFRNGCPTYDDIEYINTHCVVGPDHMPPPGVQIATYRNRDRDAVNCAIFEEYCDTYGTKNGSVWTGAMVILMDNLAMKDSRGRLTAIRSNGVIKTFFQQVGEAEATGKNRQRVDPCLKLYPGCPMMLTENADVSNGQANGSRTFLVKVTPKPGEQFFPLKLQCGTVIPAYRANQIKSITMRHEMKDITPSEFTVEPQGFSFHPTFKLKNGEEVRTAMSGDQFPIISNSCTTGHKLQGYTADALLVNDWYYGQNWAYVVLSRVKTMAGLYLVKPLTNQLKKYEMPKNMIKMIQRHKEQIGIKPIDPEVYESMLATERVWFDSN